MKNPFKKEKMTVWHPASPGVKVKVERNFFQRLFYPSEFATTGEVLADPNDNPEGGGRYGEIPKSR